MENNDYQNDTDTDKLPNNHRKQTHIEYSYYPINDINDDNPDKNGKCKASLQYPVYIIQEQSRYYNIKDIPYGNREKAYIK